MPPVLQCLLTCWHLRRNDIQHNDIQHNDIQHNNIKHSDIQHNVIQNNDIQHNDIDQNDTQHNKKWIPTLSITRNHNSTIQCVVYAEFH